MSIATELTLLANSKQAIKNSINQKGGNITDSTPLADYSTAIDNLPSGGGDNSTLIDLIERDISGNFTIPSGTTAIGQHAFTGCNSLTSVTIPSGVTSIGSNAFYNCATLVSTSIPNTVTSIGHNAFSNTGLKNITIPDSVTTIGDNAFQYSQVNSIIIGNGVTSIPENFCHSCSNLTSVTYGNNVTEIKARAFFSCGMLTQFQFTNNITSIGNEAFISTAITSISIPDSVTTIGDSCFSRCNKLLTATIGNGVSVLKYGTFNGCNSLQTIKIGNGLTSINDSQWNRLFNCSSLQSIEFSSVTPPTLNVTGVFDNTNNCPIYVPAESVDAYKAATNWSTYADRIQAIPEDVKPAFKFTSSVDSSKDITVNCEDTATAGTLTMNDLGMSSQQIDEFRSADNTGSVEIGDCVKTYMAAACYTAKGISEVKLNEGLERIGDFAFGGMSALREITIPSTVTNISYQAFYADKKLDGITCLATTPPTLGSDVFGDTNNVTIYVPYDSLDAYKSAWSQYADRIEPI